MELILFEIIHQVAYIRLNRPKVFNSFNRQMALEMQEVLRMCAEQKEIRAVVLTGEGRAFCAGQDLAEVTNPSSDLKIENIVREHYNPIILQLRQLAKPIIAAVNGVAAGAGANIALACDICVATESASFIQAFSKIGLIPDSAGTFFLPRLVGLQRATALMFLGDKISAKDAMNMGMIYQSVPDADFWEAVRKMAETLANMPTRGLALTKELLNKTYQNNLEAQLAAEEAAQATAGKTYDYNEGVKAFLEKRPAKFMGE
jgi:2-(1,2-epoxy-1,2-dihydrophenyl)acetyl-CoA isomerase